MCAPLGIAASVLTAAAVPCVPCSELVRPAQRWCSCGKLVTGKELAGRHHHSVITIKNYSCAERVMPACALLVVQQCLPVRRRALASMHRAAYKFFEAVSTLYAV
jgi:hypothetical protein